MNKSQYFQRKIVRVEAIKFTGHNDAECMQFCRNARDPVDIKANLIVPTLIGEVLCNIGDWIVKYEDGKFDVLESGVFEGSFELDKDFYK